MANTSRLVFLALAVVAASVHGYEVTSFTANPEDSKLCDNVTLQAKGNNYWETCIFIDPSGREMCKFRNENGDNNVKLAKGDPTKCKFAGKFGSIVDWTYCGLQITADDCAAGKWVVQMEQWERGFYEKKNPLKSRSLELKIDGAKPENCGEDPAGCYAATATKTTTNEPKPTPAPVSGGDSSARTSMGLMVAAVTLMALSYKY